MSRFRFLLVIGVIALLLPVLGCGSHTRCCPSKPTDCGTPACGNPNVPPPPGPVPQSGF